MMNIDFLKIFHVITGLVLGGMLAFITLGIIIGVGMLFLNLGDLIGSNDLAREYQRIISDVLTLFILIELSRSLVDYFTTRRLRMTFIVDAGIVFVLREIMIKLFEHEITTDEIYALSALLFVLGALRIGSVLVYQREKTMLDNAPKRSTV